MIILTKLDGSEILLNDDMIETVQEAPDTVVSMFNGHRYIVKETIKEIVEKRTNQPIPTSMAIQLENMEKEILLFSEKYSADNNSQYD